MSQLRAPVTTIMTIITVTMVTIITLVVLTTTPVMAANQDLIAATIYCVTVITSVTRQLTTMNLWFEVQAGGIAP